ncbi:MAG: EAL domain-containing protein [Lachnospiraceae bacterium]|nr:EAL domain-containing protein [Lachnospiraceae bacterium]
MTQETDNLHLEFLRRIAGEPLSVDRLRHGLEIVASFYGVCGIEAELLGNFKIEGEKKDIILYEKEGGVPAGEPLNFSFKLNQKRNVVFYIYSETGAISRYEREDLEVFATECLLYLELLHLTQESEKKGKAGSTEILPNASGYLRDVTELMKRDIPLKNYTAFYFNLKDFGEINRHFGRERGDEVLRDYAEIIRDFITKDEAAGHLGGDNFMALILKKRQKDFIELLSDIKIFLDSEEHEELHLSSTIGIWDIQSDVADPGEVVSRPSIALNQAKNVIHQRIAYANDRLINQLNEQRSVMKFFSEGLRKEEFVVYYQPKVDSRNKTLVGAEGLVRWFHDGKMISPGVFIPALEGTGECLALDYYVLKRACRDIQSWILQGIEPVTVSVNFSRKDLKDSKLADNINKIVEESGIDKSLIEVELTETVDTEEQGVLSGFISKLYRKGIMTAIDDFGSGYSSLSTLRDFQVHTLKLDRSFVNTDDFSWKDEIILRNIIHMAEELGMDILCEGVERDDQLALINSVGCYVIQGYYYDRPLPPGDFEERLKSKIYH